MEFNGKTGIGNADRAFDACLYTDKSKFRLLLSMDFLAFAWEFS